MTRDRCLILACGNPLRGDDGAAWHVAEAALRLPLPDGVRVVIQQQWTAELAEDIADADSVLFVDCSLGLASGDVSLSEVAPAATLPSFLTHHQDAASLLSLSQSLYRRTPARCSLLVIGAVSLGHCDELSEAVRAALPEALELLRGWVRQELPV